MASPGKLSRETSIIVVVLETSEVFIVASLSIRKDTQVIRIDPSTGALCYRGKSGYDLFLSEGEALNYITDGSRWLCKSTTNARAILGYSALGSFGLLLVATKLSTTIPSLPGGGCIHTVAESQWIKIPLQSHLLQGKGELKNIQELTDIDIDGKHYFCETRDVSRPFPSRMPLHNPDAEFVWNEWLSMPFKDIGLPHHCVILLQGFAECRSFGGSGQQTWMVSLIARRSRLHPGTRYLARGINSCFSTGNEVECEQLVWISQRAGQTIPLSTYIWRRGTIPMWWGAELKFTAAEAEIYVASHDPYKGSLQYYDRLSRRYGLRHMDITIPNQKKNPFVPIVCMNLLRKGEGKSESILVEHFAESLNSIRSCGKLPNTRVHLINYDWHTTVKMIGEQKTVEGIWKLLKAPTLSIEFSEGSYSPSKQTIQKCKGAVVLNNDVEGGFCLTSLQNGVIRFNCADSLDRTNAASFFGALQVFIEQCRRLGINLERDLGFSMTNNYMESSNFGGNAGSLPPGWEEKTDAVTGKTFYVNHNTRTTTWEYPCPDKPWKRFDMSFDQFKSSTALYPITQLSELFLLAGDIHATLYTGSKAMHSQILSIFNNETGKFKQFSVAQNMKITVQRRIQNVLNDSSRQKQLEMFLGIRLFKHLPSVPVHPLQVLSRPPYFLKPIAHMFPNVNGEPNLLSFKSKDIVWVCSPSADFVEFFIYLGEPCHVCELLLTVSHGEDDSTFPGKVDVRTGSNLDELKLVVEDACIPQCSKGSTLVIPLTGAISSEDRAVTGSGARLYADGNPYSLLYDFEELEGELNFLTRVVALTFHPNVHGSTPVTFGEIEVLGASLPWQGIFSNKEIANKYVQRTQKVSKETELFVIDGDTKHSNNPFLCESSHELDSVSTSGGNFPGLSTSQSVPNYGFDLLSGEFSFEQPPSQAEKSNPLESSSPSAGVFDVFEDCAIDLPLEEAPKDNSRAENYLNHLKNLSFKGHKLNFVEAIGLEIERLRSNLSAAERDRVLLSVGVDPVNLDPNRLVDDYYLNELCKTANRLALLGQAVFEDKIVGSIGLETVGGDALDFWNVSGIMGSCSGGLCEVLAETKTHSQSENSSKFLVCSSCKRKTCKACCAGMGASVFLNYILKEIKNSSGSSSQNGSRHGGQIVGSSISADSIICKSCCKEVILHALYVDYVRVLSGLRRRDRADSAAIKSLNQVVPPKSNLTHGLCQGIQMGRKQLYNLLIQEDSLAEFPYASLLHSVETAVGSEPPLSLLAPIGAGPDHAYWKAPPSCSKVEFSIVLGGLSDVCGVIMLASSCGYSVKDCPIVQIWASNKINREERSCIGKWSMSSLIAPDSELFRPETADGRANIPRHVKFPFRNSVRCRIIWIMLTLPQAGSNSISLERDYSLLSLDDTLFPPPDRRNSFSDTVDQNRCIHAKRFIVYGKAVRKEQSRDPSGSDNMSMRSWLDRPPQLARFRVPIEAERLTGNDLILEQFLSPISPGLAGFRFDALNVIKPRITHSPAPDDVDVLQSSLTCLEDRHIFPAVLQLHVSVVQDSQNLITVGEYRLPEVRAGTPLYFDFATPIQARMIIFKLHGDLAAFCDDISDQTDPDSRASALALGLSLANKIKLYYYADPYEYGKLANLSTV